MDLEDSDACERCSSIPWERLDRLSSKRKILLKDIAETSEGLRSSGCHSCRVFGACFVSFEKPVVSLSWRKGRFEVICTNDTFYRSTNLELYDEDDQEFIDSCADVSKRISSRSATRSMQDCESTHNRCKLSQKPILEDLHVLDCHSKIVIPAPKDCDFIALSYVWGRSRLEETTRFPKLPRILPRTVEDSIEATKIMGYQYLWVDRYCIDQGDSIAKQVQINQMGNIYISARVTIIAAAGEDAYSGLPGVGYDFDTAEFCAVAPRLRLVNTVASASQSIHESIWYSRAWTYQEGYLSIRRMYFTENNMHYLCHENIKEDRFYGIFASLPSGAPITSQARRMMCEYTRRGLSYDSDALNAILGALDTLEGADHIWGVTLALDPDTVNDSLPAIDIALDWNHAVPSLRRKGFPSWSPLGWRGAITYLTMFSGPIVPSACSLRVWRDGEYRPLRESFGRLSQQHHMGAPKKSMLLETTSTIVMLDFEYVVEGAKSQAGFYAKVPYSKELNLFIMPFWDVDCRDAQVFKGGRAQLPCTVVLRNRKAVYLRNFASEKVRFEDEIMVLILQQYDDRYERIGCFRLSDSGLCAFAQDNQGRNVDIENPFSRTLGSYGDGAFWAKNGVKNTFLLG